MPVSTTHEESGGGATVLLLEDEVLTRDTLQVALEARGFRVVPVGDLEALKRALRRVKPDLALIDLVIVGREDGFEAPQIIRTVSPTTLCMALTNTPDPAIEGYVRRAMRDADEAVRFDGFITKYSPIEQLFEAIRTLMRDGAYVSPTLLRHLTSLPTDELTPVELSYLQAVRNGLKGEALREALRRGGNKLSQRQAVRYSKQVREKLKTRSIAEAVAEGLKRRLIK